MNSTILISGLGAFELEDPWDLSADLTAQLKKRKGQRGSVRCARCNCDLTFVEHPTCPHLRRLGTEDDDRLCFHSRKYSPRSPNEGQSDSFKSCVISGLDSNGLLLSEANYAEYFSLWGRYVLSRSYSSVFTQATGIRDVQPSLASAVFSAATDLLSSHTFADVELTLSELSLQNEVDLMFGIAAESSVLETARANSTNTLPLVLWPSSILGYGSTDSTGIGKPEIAYFQEAELFRCANYFKNHGHVTRGPYFFLATKRHNQFVRLYLYPIAIFNCRIAPVDSELERQDVCSTWAEGHELYKCLRLKDQSIIPHALRSRLPETRFLFSYRPDAIVYTGQSIIVREVKGYTDGRHEGYESAFEYKCSYYSDASRQGHFEFEAIDASQVMAKVGSGYPQDRLPGLFD